MSGIFNPKEPDKIDVAGEKDKLQRQRAEKLQRSAFNVNTRTSGAQGVTGSANTFRSTLGG